MTMLLNPSNQAENEDMEIYNAVLQKFTTLWSMTKAEMVEQRPRTFEERTPRENAKMDYEFHFICLRL